MSKRILSIGMLVTSVFLGGNSGAQESGIDRDPFFSDGPRSTATVTAPSQQGTDWGRDPFTRPFDEKVSVQKTETRRAGGKLTGIIYSETNRIAIIDGETVREGGFIGDQKLVSIRKRSIVLMNFAGAPEELFLENFSIRK